MNNSKSNQHNSSNFDNTKHISNDRIFDSNNYSFTSKSKSQKSIQNDFLFRTQSSPSVLFENNQITAKDSSKELEQFLSKSKNKSLLIESPTSQINEKTEIYNHNFTSDWNSHKRLYLKVQIIFLTINLITNLALLGLSVWINVHEPFRLITSLANKVLYSSMNRIVAFLPIEFLSISCISFCLDISQYFSYFYTKKFLNSHNKLQIETILNNQRALANAKNSFNDEDEIFNLKIRVKIKRSLKNVKINLKALLFFEIFIYLFVLFTVSYFTAIYLHFNSKSIINYELPQTLLKVIREYEKQQASLVSVNSTEENLVNRINIEFKCCHYQNAYQYGDLAPKSCNFERGCLKPLQEFTWNYFYFTVIGLLSWASLKFLIQIVIFANFFIVLNKRLVNKLYNVNLRELINNEEDQTDKEKAKQKLIEIRRNKEIQLEMEDLEEQAKLEREEFEFTNKHELNLDIKQQEYEKMLLKQKRFKELKFEQMQRRLQTQHLLEFGSDMNENSF